MSKYVKFNGLTVSKGNLKLDDFIVIFNLPSIITCPNCSKCASTCYASKAEVRYPKVKACRQLNFALSQKDSFVEDMVKLLIKTKTKVVRIHESGDFYSQEYADKWTNIALQLPEVQFYAYTKSPYRPCSDNINIVESILPDGSLNYGPVEVIVPKAKQFGAYVCPCKPGDRHKLCGSICTVCRTNPFVVFVQH